MDSGAPGSEAARGDAPPGSGPPRSAASAPDIGAPPEELAFVARVLHDRARRAKPGGRAVLAGTILIAAGVLVWTAVPRRPERTSAPATAAIPTLPASAIRVSPPAAPAAAVVP